MAVITEDYVSFETAKLLKEKGFDSECHSYYFPYFCPDGSVQYDKYVKTELTKNLSYYEIYSLKNLPKDYYLAPTLQMAMKWLRKEHNVYVQIKYERHAGYNKYGYTSTLIFIDDLSQTYVTWKPSYEEAAEFAIKYYLENPT